MNMCSKLGSFCGSVCIGSDSSVGSRSASGKELGYRLDVRVAGLGALGRSVNLLATLG